MPNKQYIFNWYSLLLELIDHRSTTDEERKVFKDLIDKKDSITVSELKKIVEAYADKIGFTDVKNTAIQIKW